MANPPSSSSSEPHLLPPNPTHTRSSLSLSPSNPPSPKLKQKLEPAAENDVVTSSPAKKTPPLPWTHQETVSLIQGYQEKWYSLKKGQLKANQWEEVAITVAARCGYDQPSKSSTQCRHKIEKLRKRYRAERVKPHPNAWPYFELMDQMERGPLPIAARPMSMVKYQNSNSVGNYDDESDTDGDASYGGGLDVKRNKLKSINNIVRGDLGGNLGMSSNHSNRNVNRVITNQNCGGGGGSGSQRSLKGTRNTLAENRNIHFENDESDEEEEAREGGEGEGGEEEVREGAAGKEVAAEVRGFAERFMTMENTKIEMIREAERYRMDMENKRMQMIVESQRKMVDTIGRAFSPHKKVKMTQEI